MELLRTIACSKSALLSTVLALASCSSSPAHAQEPPRFDAAFWSSWGDGKAELASYQLRTPRYGSERQGTAVAIFVTETFDPVQRVKQERASADGVPVMKLNLVQDFQTGIYDYNLMTSTFVALKDFEGRPAGSLLKESFSAQEWCGHAYQQVDVRKGELRHVLHSYFEGEADKSETLASNDKGLAEDALLLWARGCAGPSLKPGESKSVALLRSLETTRLQHVALLWDDVKLSRSPETVTVEVPAGKFVADLYEAEITRRDSDKPNLFGQKLPPTRKWTIHVEHDAPQRVVRFETSDGKVGELLATARLKYWELNKPGGEAELGKLGLTPRPPRTP